MNAAQILAGIDHAVSDQEHVAAVRKLLIGLAVTGRLDASNTRRVLPPSVERRGVSAPIMDSELPVAGMAAACFARLGDIAAIRKGETGIQKAKPGEFPLVVTAAQRATADHYDFEDAAAIVPLVSSTGHGKASLHRLHYQEGRYAVGNILAAVFPSEDSGLSARFLYEYLSAFKEELLVTRMTGTANVALTISKLKEVPVPLVSTETQRVIDELMALCDRLEAAQVEREARRDRLVAASLARVSQPAAADAASDARAAGFHLDHFARLTTRPEHVKHLRQTILNLAVRGRLVPQDPGDEPAQNLLNKSQPTSESAVRPRRGRTAATRRGTPVEATVDLPLGWTPACLSDVTLKITDGAHKTPTYVDEGIPFVSVKDFSRGKLDLTNTRFIPTDEHETLYRRCDPRRGDILLGRIGTLGKAVVVDTDIEFSLFVSVALLRFDHHILLPGFFKLALNSPVMTAEFDRVKIGGATHTNKLNLGDLKTLSMWLPPLAEQRRIVAKVDELLALCDQLEASLAAAATDRARLLESLLHDALATAA